MTITDTADTIQSVTRLSPTTLRIVHTDGTQVIAPETATEYTKGIAWDVVSGNTIVNIQTAEQKKADDIAVSIDRLWSAAHLYEYNNINGSALVLLAKGVVSGKPKALAVEAWITAIWKRYFQQKAKILNGNNSFDSDFSSLGKIPHSIPALMAELGI